ncbi:hypothetical protein Nocox_29945 [Nonomuraea coxensis DSM 45129]|uniref:Uncharacterized protein n=1 Tax=Nonomuraea coxensis DSM 45129 TaxID=1122611 RepID=A0ABX8UA24_9ACTN|nr:hypothetical protein Nocox_29945 [Nonomuraea coxensis DSM 45129]
MLLGAAARTEQQAGALGLLLALGLAVVGAWRLRAALTTTTS